MKSGGEGGREGGREGEKEDGNRVCESFLCKNSLVEENLCILDKKFGFSMLTSCQRENISTRAKFRRVTKDRTKPNGKKERKRE